MLSKNHQLLLIYMFRKSNREGEGLKVKAPITSDEGVESSEYSGRYSFYQGINYLVEGGLVEKKRRSDGTNIYFLSLGGELVANALLDLPDVDQKLKEFEKKISEEVDH